MIKDRFNNTIDIVYSSGRKETWAVNTDFRGLFVEDSGRFDGFREIRGGWDTYSPTPRALLDNIRYATFADCDIVKGSVRGFHPSKTLGAGPRANTLEPMRVARIIKKNGHHIVSDADTGSRHSHSACRSRKEALKEAARLGYRWFIGGFLKRIKPIPDSCLPEPTRGLLPVKPPIRAPRVTTVAEIVEAMEEGCRYVAVNKPDEPDCLRITSVRDAGAWIGQKIPSATAENSEPNLGM